jgi:hypothetical protein
MYETTLWWLAAGVAVIVLASLGERVKARAPLAWHAHLPWRPAIFLGMTVCLFAAVHLATLARGG